MTVEEEIRTVERYLRARGLRWTSQRELIARIALESHDHFTAEELLEMCRAEDRGVSRATVYRTLGLLEEAGFVEGLDTGDGSRKFEHVLGHEHHDHMVCTECGKILEFRDEELERRQEAAAARVGFRITGHSLRLLGVCAECQQTGTRRRAADEASAE